MLRRKAPLRGAPLDPASVHVDEPISEARAIAAAFPVLITARYVVPASQVRHVEGPDALLSAEGQGPVKGQIKLDDVPLGEALASSNVQHEAFPQQQRAAALLRESSPGV